jgi:hypothetical protein
VKRNVFKRLNTGGLPLTSQEIRHALYQGQVTDLLATLAESKSFKEATDCSINDSRMAARELVLYFLAFAVFPYSAYKGNMDKWLSNAMRVINLMPNLEQPKLLKIFDSQEHIPEIQVRTIEQLTQHFELAMARGVALFGKHTFRKSLSIEGSRRTPVNKALFETWGNILASLSQREFNILIKNQKRFEKIYHIVLMGDEDLFDTLYDDIFLEKNSKEEKLKSNRYKKIQKLAFFVHSENIDNISLFRLQETLSDKSISKVKRKLRVLLDGSLGKSLEDAISRNASEIESVKKRHKYFNDLVKNIITYAKQEQSA